MEETRKPQERRRRRASEQSDPESEEEGESQGSPSNRVDKLSECESEGGTVEEHDLSEYESATENGEEEVEYEVEVEYEEGDSVVIDSEYDEGEWIDEERQSGDGEEQPESTENLDDDEDKKNPAYVPRKGAFYEHDLRTGDELKKEKEEQKKLWKDEGVKWDHDKYHSELQAPKSRDEIVAIYGYDIRAYDRPPDAPKRRPRTDPRNRKNRIQDYIPDPNYSSQDAREQDYEQRPNKHATSNGEYQERISPNKEDFPPLEKSLKEQTNIMRENSPNYEKSYSRGGGRGRGGRGSSRGGGGRGRGAYTDMKNRGDYHRDTEYYNDSNRDNREYRNNRDNRYHNNRDYNTDNYQRDNKRDNNYDQRDNRDTRSPRGYNRDTYNNRGGRDGNRSSNPRQYTNSSYQGAKSDPIPRLQHLSERKLPPEKSVIVDSSTKSEIETRSVPRMAGTGRVKVSSAGAPPGEHKSYQRERRNKGIGRTRVQHHEGIDEGVRDMSIHDTPPPESSSPSSTNRGNSNRSYPHISPDEKPIMQPISQLQSHRPIPERGSRSPNDRKNFNQGPPGQRNDPQNRTKRYSSQRQRPGMTEQSGYQEQQQQQQQQQVPTPAVIENRAFFPTSPPGQPRAAFPRAPVFPDAPRPQLTAPPPGARFAAPPILPQGVAPFTIPVSSAIGSVGMPYNPPPSAVVKTTTQNVIPAAPSGAPVYVPVSIVSYGMPPPSTAPHYQMAGQLPIPQVYSSTGPEGIHVRGGTTYFSPEVQALQGTMNMIQRPQTKTRQKAAIPIVNPQDMEKRKGGQQLITQEQIDQGLYYESGNTFQAPDGTVYKEFHPASMIKATGQDIEQDYSPESITPVNSPNPEEMAEKSMEQMPENVCESVTEQLKTLEVKSELLADTISDETENQPEPVAVDKTENDKLSSNGNTQSSPSVQTIEPQASNVSQETTSDVNKEKQDSNVSQEKPIVNQEKTDVMTGNESVELNQCPSGTTEATAEKDTKSTSQDCGK